MLLDDAMPRWDRREVHRIATGEPSAALFAAARDLTWGEVPAFKALMKVRGLGRLGLGADAPVFDWFTDAGFQEVACTDDEMLIVTIEGRGVGTAERRAQSGVDTFREYAGPGRIKIAFNFRCAEGSLITETRVRGTDARSRRVFAAYWLAIRIGSGIIRRVWLRAIRARARTGVGEAA